MARTDHANYYGNEWNTSTPWHYRTATGWSKPAKLHKMLKRAKSKANRRAIIPQTQMRGYGWGRDNYKLWND